MNVYLTVFRQGLTEHAGDSRLHVVRRGVEVLADLRHKTRREISQRPMIVHFGSHAQLTRNYARRYGRNQLVQLKIIAELVTIVRYEDFYKLFGELEINSQAIFKPFDA